ELAGLADDDRAGADDEEAGDVVALGHQAWFSLVVVWCASSSSTKRSKRWAASCGPAAPSGWYWTEKPRSRDPVSSRSSSPSTTSSLRQRWLTRARPKGVGVSSSSGASTAKPWLWTVMSTCPVARSCTGWLIPRWPY